MITRIEGMADNHALQFMPVGDGYWEAKVPPDLDDGMYIVALRAWDDAGNSAYYATAMMMVEAGHLAVTWLPDMYVQRWVDDIYTCTWLPDQYDFIWR